jgi:hypothetical protein
MTEVNDSAHGAQSTWGRSGTLLLRALEVSPLAPVADLIERSLSAGDPGGAELCFLRAA